MAAVASARFMGRGDEYKADASARDAFRAMMSSVDIKGTIVIGEGDPSELGTLKAGELIGTGKSLELDIVADPLEGSKICAHGGFNAISALAIGGKGQLLAAPDIYMNKLAVGPIGRGVIDILESPLENLKRLADVKKCRIQDLTAIILDRARHANLLENLRSSGARIMLIRDGDLAGALATCREASGVDILFGSGGAQEGVMAAAAMRCLGGEIQAQFTPKDESEIKLLKNLGPFAMGVMKEHDMAKGDVMFCATGISSGHLLEGVQFHPWGAITHSLVMRSQSGTVRSIMAEHHFDKKPVY